MKLNINDDESIENPADSDFVTQITNLEKEEFAILEQASEKYIQTYANKDGSYQLEYRDGSLERHYEATHEVTVDDIISAFQAYNSGADDWHSAWQWEKMELSISDYIISTENVEGLPNPTLLQKFCKTISAAEAIICSDWEMRYYSYQKDWGDNEEVCILKNGCGDEVQILFSEHGVCINGFAHESDMNGWKGDVQTVAKGVLDNVPAEFNDFIFGQPVAGIGTTFCMWQTKTDDMWHVGDIELPKDHYADGSAYLLQFFDGYCETYQEWAEEYYEQTVSLEVLEQMYVSECITKEMVIALNPEFDDWKALQDDLDEIGVCYDF